MTDKDKQTTPDLSQHGVVGTEIFNLSSDQQPGSGPDVEPTAASPAPAIETQDEPDKEKPSEDPDAEEKNFRFKSHEEAEKAYKTQQAHVTKIEQEKKDLAQKMTQLKSRISEFESKEQKEKEVQIKESVDKEVLDYSKQRHEEVLAAIDELDPEDSEHAKKVAALWAGLNADIRKFEREAAEKVQTKIQEAEPEKIKTDPPPAPAEDPGQADPEDFKYVEAKVVQAGRDPLSPAFRRAASFAPEKGEGDAELTLDEQIEWALNKENEIIGQAKSQGIESNDPAWLYFLQKAPVKSEKGEEIALDDQIQWAIEKTKEHKAAEIARIKQELNLPLSASAAGRKHGTDTGIPAEGISFGDAIDKAVESRRL